MSKKKRRKWVTQTGVQVRSGYEQRVLDNLTERDIEYEYEPENITWYERLTEGVCRECGGHAVERRRGYIPDLVVTRVRGRPPRLCGFIELKGIFTADDRKTLLGAQAVLTAVGDGQEISILFQRDNWLTTKRVTRYSEWARKQGIKFSIGEEIPESWLK